MSSDPTSGESFDLNEAILETPFHADETEELDTDYSNHSEPNVENSNSITGSEELNKDESLDLLKAAFKNVTNCNGTKTEVTFVKGAKEGKIDSWCEQVYSCCLQRFQHGSSTLPTRTKRGGCGHSPEYVSCSDRVRAVARVLQSEKRACYHFRRDLGWAQKLADDPVYERDNMHASDRGNHERTRRAQQSKANGHALVEEVQMLKDVLVADPENITVEMVLARLDRIEDLAVYVRDPPKAERQSLGVKAHIRAESAGEANQEDATDNLVTPDMETDASLYKETSTPSSVDRQLPTNIETSIEQPFPHRVSRPLPLDPNQQYSHEQYSTWCDWQRVYQLQKLGQMEEADHTKFYQEQGRIIEKHDKQHHAQQFFERQEARRNQFTVQLEQKLTEHSERFAEIQQRLRATTPAMQSMTIAGQSAAGQATSFAQPE